MAEKQILIDCTGLSNCHRTRGVGRYVNGLLSGMLKLKEEGSFKGSVGVFCGQELNLKFVDKQLIFKQYTSTAEKMYWENLFFGSKLIKKSGASVFHSTSMDGVVRDFPWVATCHDLIPLCYPKDYLPLSSVIGNIFWKRYLSELKINVDQVICISEEVKQVLTNQFNVDESKLSVVYHGLSQFWFSKAKPEEVSPAVKVLKDRGFFLFVGGFDPRKNFDRLAKALVNMNKFNDFQLVVVGHRSRKIKKRHSRLLENLKFQPVFLEYVNDQEMLFLYNNCRALLFPSYCEGWGFPIVEAMASGARVLCGNIGSMKESSLGLGNYVDVFSEEDIARGIESLIDHEDDTNEREKRIEAVRQFSWENCAKETVKVYEKAQNSK